jgi:voltage-gated potassium channel
VGARRRVRVGLALLFAVSAIGTAWYWLVEGFGFVDALYQSITTLATVGFSEVHPLGTRGRLFTIVFIVVGVGVALYTLSAVAGELLENQFGRLGRWRMDRRIDSLRGHVVVCGFGRVGQEVTPLVAPRAQVVVVDTATSCVEAAEDAGLLTVLGDATEDDVLERAGVARASTVVVSLASDADAISTVLSVRALNPECRVVARANAASAEAKLVRAGVDHVVNPLALGARRLATFALQPAVADFMDVVMPDGPVEFRLEELLVPEGSPMAGTTLGGSGLREATGALLLAVREPGGEFSSNPGPATELRVGATLIAIGTDTQLAALADRLGRGTPPGPGRRVDGHAERG